ncbi:MAG: phosphoglucosamine mutase [Candidatus Micrarchaeota archaeon]
MSRYFGTNGVRGLFNKLGPELALNVAQAVGVYFGRGKIVLARDGRITGEVLHNAVSAGLMSVGCDVIDLGFAPAPTAEFMVKKLKADGCIIITASHNPPEWNALKVVDSEGIAVSKERGEEIEKLMDSVIPAGWDKTGGISQHPDAIPEHIDAIKGLVESPLIRARAPKIVLDCGNGMAALIAPKLLSQLGAEAVVINGTVDGNFPGRPSEPTEKNVRGLIESVKKENADAGIAWDGDADRVVFVDETGSYVIGDKVFALSVLWKLGQKKGNIVTTVATSKAAEDIAASAGCKTIYTKIGAPYLSEEVAKGECVMGGEEVGGVIWPEMSLAKDGLLTAAKMVESICERPLSKWLMEVPEYHNVKKMIKADDEKKKRIVAKMLDYAKENRLDYTDIDGVRVNLPDGWVIIRASGTENYIRVFAEARTKERAEGIIKEYMQVLE